MMGGGEREKLRGMEHDRDCDDGGELTGMGGDGGEGR